MSATQRESVVIAVLTYQRPEDLAIILPHLLEQADSIKASVLVIDNDPNASAQVVAESFPAPTLRYVNETRPGIAAARNRALAESVDMDLLAFIDDDETPTKGWLRSLLSQYDLTRPTGVTGPVISEFAHEPSTWIRDSTYFTRPRRATGDLLPAAATSNLLLDLQQVRAMNLTFDERFGLSGGSDTLFTRQVVEQGGQIVWCDEAVVIDRVPPGRLNRAWILKRSLRSGNSWSRVSLAMTTGLWQRLLTRGVLTLRGATRMAGGSARFLLGLLTLKVGERAKGLQTTARGAGMLSGAYGYVYSEYSRKAAS